MRKSNPIFEKTYGSYLRQLDNVDLSLYNSVLGIIVDEERKTVRIPFFKKCYQISRFGVIDDQGKRPDYGTCVILLKYLLMRPKWVPGEKDWIHFRDFKDSVQAQNAGLSDYATKKISELFSGGLDRLKTAVEAIGGNPPEIEYPYDLSAVITALPRIPILFLFNDADEQFPAQASILYERRAEHFLDAECRVMVDWSLQEYLTRTAR